ncbi:MAG: hypothetical protein GF353_22690 [Candidatus Lokiarchaeota archaeon]|nr:hypothetical protein [Candidatus Lokiarchaeota archaeon]
MDKKEILQIINSLASVRAPSGMEKERGLIYKKEIIKSFSKYNISVNTDALQNFYVKLKGINAKKDVAILAHIDEIGGTIRRIKKNGYLEFSRRGGYEGRWLVSRTIQILNKDGKWINGVIGGRSTHSTPEKLRSKEKIDPLEMKIYIGAKSRDEVINKYGIHVGSPLVFKGEFGLFNPDQDDNIIAGYSMDNLAALTSLIVLSERISTKLLTDYGSCKIPYNIHIVATSREEIGTEGAHHYTRVNNIDQVIAIDIAPVADFSGSVNSGIKLDGGPVIVWQERRGSGVMDYDFCRSLIKIAEKNALDYQNGVFEFYGSDAGKSQKWLGISSALIGIPVLFSHNVPEISTLNAIKNTAELIYLYLKSLK